MSHLWFIVRWLHLAMAFFVGGQMMLAGVVVPVARRSTDRESLRVIARRFGYGTLVALLVLIATGTAMAFHLGLWSNGTFHVKLAPHPRELASPARRLPRDRYRTTR